jgi:hypothetical protein
MGVDNGLIALGVVIVLALVVVALGIKFYPVLKKEQQGYPLEAQVEAALLPVLFQGICAAYRLSEQGMDELHIRFDGVNKKAVADMIYALLPDKVGDFDLTLVKALVPPDRFEQLIQDAFDRFDRFWVEHQASFGQAFEQWKLENGELR